MARGRRHRHSRSPPLVGYRASGAGARPWHSGGVNRAVVAVMLAILGCNAGSATPVPQPAPEPATPGSPMPVMPGDASVDADVSRLAGKPLYMALCAPCHAADGRGYAADRAPSLVNPTFLESASDDFLRRSIAAGRPGTSMAAYSKLAGGPLDDAGVERLVTYLRG